MQFEEMNLMPEIIRAVEELGYRTATDIQSGAIPLILEGKDLIGRSSTGTGKTAAFGIPIVQMTALGSGTRGQVLILSPTRELAMQISNELHKYAKYLSGVSMATVYGGQPMQGQIRQLKTAKIIIGTPGRVMDHLRRKTMTLENLRTVVLDEADEMLNMGFLDDIRTILSQAPEQRQTLLFSATMPPSILAITKDFQTNPAMVAVDKGQKTVDGISQFYYRVPQKDKIDALKLLLEYHRPKRALIFCNTKKMVEKLCTELNNCGFQAAALHGDMKQNQRTQVMNSFKNGRSSLLIATDVAARGIDVENVDAVFNFDIPQENEYYIHRIGRTGRAGRTGSSYTLAANRSQTERMRSLERFLNVKISEATVPNLEDIHQRHVKNFLTT
jgi:ATP-dependent RNA helicase DeaD